MEFSAIYDRALKRKGGKAALDALLPNAILSPAELKAIADDRFLSAMTQTVFQTGFNRSVILKKWPGFEDAFWRFNIKRCAFIGPDDFDALLGDDRIVKHAGKINSVQCNAEMVSAARRTHGTFSALVADWPNTDFIGLLDYLKRNGARLGGSTGAYFLRHMGRDGFILGKDGVAVLMGAGVVEKAPTSKSAMAAVQTAFNEWMNETGYSLAHLSRILALSVGEPLSGNSSPGRETEK